jgi:hypothetical protein
VSVWQTFMVFVVPAVALYLLLATTVMVPHRARRPRYRVGQPWTFPPLWWTANPEGAQLPAPDEARATRGERGGARGTW